MENWEIILNEISSIINDLTEVTEIILKEGGMMKLPNGFGCIRKMSGNRRKPYAVCKSIDGRQKYLGSFETREDAFQYLIKLNGGKFIRRKTDGPTFEELYHEWKQEKWPMIGESSKTSYESAYAYCSDLWRMSFIDVRYKQIQAVMDKVREKGLSYSSQKKVKTLLYQLYEYACKTDIVDKNYAQYLELGKNVPVYKKRPYSREEIDLLWEHTDDEAVQEILMLIYCGVRIGELLALKVADVHLQERWFLVRNSKTAAGRNRRVPIAKKVLPFWKTRCQDKNIFVLNRSGKKYSYTSYHERYKKALKRLGLVHTLHETRHTCASLLNSAGANDVCVKMILGHQQDGITKQVYTHKTLAELIHAINLI